MRPGHKENAQIKGEPEKREGQHAAHICRKTERHAKCGNATENQLSQNFVTAGQPFEFFFVNFR